MGKNDFTLFLCLFFRHSSDVASEPIDSHPPTDPPRQSQNFRSHLPDNHHGCQGFGLVPNLRRFWIFACIFVPWAPFLDASFWSLCAQFAVECFFQPSGSRLGPFGTMPVSCIRHKGTHPGGDLGRGDDDGDLCCHCCCCGENQPPRGPPSGKEVMAHNVLGTTSSSARN